MTGIVDISGVEASTGGGGGGTPGGSDGQVQYNNAGAFGGISGWTTNGTTTLVGGASTTLTVGGGSAITSSGAGGALGALAFEDNPTSGQITTGLGYTPLAPANNLSDVVSASSSRTNLGLGTAATQNTGTSGANVPLLNGANTWSGTQIFGTTGPLISGGQPGFTASTLQLYFIAGVAEIEAVGPNTATNGQVGFWSARSNGTNEVQLGALFLQSGSAALALGSAGNVAYPMLLRSGTVTQFRLGDNSAYAPLEAGTVRTATPYTVSTLPAGSAGMRAYVTDANAPTFLGALTGGGSVVCPVFYNGTAWVAG